MVNFLQHEKPDVVLLQEAINKGRGEFEGVTMGAYQKLKQALGMEGVFAPMINVQNDRGGYEFGPAALTRLPIKNKWTQFYVNKQVTIEQLIKIRQERYPGVTVAIKIDVDGLAINFFSVHFVWSLYPQVIDDQRVGAGNLMRIIAEHQPAIIGGDFNVTDESEIYQIFKQKWHDDRPQDIKYTLHPQLHNTQGGKLAVDYLWHQGSEINLLKSQVIEVPLSDHLPVIATYKLT